MKLSTSISTAVKYITLFTSLCMFSTLKSKACGPDFAGWQYTMLLEYYTFNHPYFNYQFDPSNRFYARSWSDGEEADKNYTDDTKYNLQTWRSYLQLPATVQDSDLKTFIYKNSIAEVKKLSLQQNSSDEIVKSINNQKNSGDVWQYLLLMNEYNQFVAPPQDVWDYASYTNLLSMDTVKPFVIKCENLISKSDDPFLQWRSLYLILRATHFHKYHSMAITKFEKYNALISHDNSLAQYWCEGVYAGALLRNKQEDKAIYYTARTFANCPDQQLQAMNTYLFSKRQWKTALPYCKDAKDSIYVALLEGANHTLPDMEFIQLIYKTNPNSEVLKLLWLREAKKIEEFVLQNYTEDDKNIFYLNYDTPVDMDSLYTSTKTIAQFLDLSEKILNNPANIPVKITVANAAAYYYYKKGELSKASACLAKIAALQKDEMEKLQYQLLSGLVNLKKSNTFDTDLFTSLITSFKKLSYGNTNHHVGYYLMYNELAPYFLSQKDTSTAFWMYTCANSFDAEAFSLYGQDYSPESFNYPNHATWLLNQYYSTDQVMQLKKQYQNRKGKSAFETWLISNTKLLDGQKLFNLVIARKYMLAEQWDLAIKMLDEMPPVFNEQKGSNPANFYVNDYMDDDLTKEKNTYSVKQILELAQKLKINADSNVASSGKDKLLYATVLYNLSFYGKNHYIEDNHWYHSNSKTAYYSYDSIDTHVFLNDEDVYAFPLHKSYQDYFHLTTAEKYLKEALPLLNADEEKAQCTFLLAKCWQKRCPAKMVYNTEYKYMEDLSDYVGHSKNNPYFKALATQFKNTKLQQQVFNSCSYYRMYLGKK